MKTFGAEHYKNIALVDFTANPRMQALFEQDYDIPRILSQLAIETNVVITPGETLIIFDEIQEVPRAITALKYFYEEAPEYHIVSAGSLLGVALHQDVSFPVGKVDSFFLHPLSFCEFLSAMDKDLLAKAVREASFDQLQPLFTDELTSYLKEYLFVGGMPAVVADYSKYRDTFEARRLQLGILQDYNSDFSKHVPSRTLEKVRLVWESIAPQLSKENKKFVFGAVRPGARSKDLEEAIQWLVDYGVVRKVPHASAIRTPIKSYASPKDFKLFLLDVGLLGARAGLEARLILNGSALFTEFKGALSEQYVEQQLESEGFEPCYWSASNTANEIDFVVDCLGLTWPDTPR